MASEDRAQPSVVCLMGQTATGKTDVSVELARRLPVDIISVDSAMVYRGMDIGTAKPTADILREAPHRLIDIREPEETYSAGDFRTDALIAIREVIDAGRVPLLVGGTMLYFRALQRGLAAMPPADAEVRATIDSRASVEGWPALHAELAHVDPLSASRIAQDDAQRIQRALEVFRVSGRRLSEWHERQIPARPAWHYLNFALVMDDRARLRERISRRFSAMMEAGFLEEVEKLLARPTLTPDAPALKAVGYRQLCRHLRGECNLPTARLDAEVATRRLAKRQHTWIRGEPDLRCLDPLDPRTPGLISAEVEEIVRCLGRAER